MLYLKKKDITIQYEEELDLYAEWYEQSMTMVKEVKPKNKRKENYFDYTNWWRNDMDITKHMDFYNPMTEFKDQIHIIGCGAIGST